MLSRAAAPSVTRWLSCMAGHWLRMKANSLPIVFSLPRVASLAQMSKIVGRAGIRQRSATFMAASEAGVSVAGVSMITRVTLLFSSVAMASGSLPAETHSMGRFLSARRRHHLVRDFCGSISIRKTRSPASCAATARQADNVLFPDPPFCVTMATVRISDSPSARAPGTKKPLKTVLFDSLLAFDDTRRPTGVKVFR